MTKIKIYIVIIIVNIERKQLYKQNRYNQQHFSHKFFYYDDIVVFAITLIKY